MELSNAFGPITRRWHRRYTVLALCTLAFFATAFARFVISPLVPSIRAEFGIGNTLIGIALTGMWFTYAISQYPSGVFAGRFGERRLILVAIGGTAIASLLTAIAPGFWLFLLCVVVLGVVSGLHFSVAATLLEREFENTGTALGLHNTGGPAAGLVAPVVASLVGVTYGWRYAVAIGAVLGVFTFVLFTRGVRPIAPRRPNRTLRSQFTTAAVMESLTRPSILFSLCLASVSMFVWQANVSFLPTFLMEHRGVTQTDAGIVFSAYFVAQGTLQVGVGSLSDRYTNDGAFALCMVASGVGFGSLLVVPDAVGVVIGVFFLGIGLSSQVAVMARILDDLPEAEKSSGFGIVRTVYLCIASLGSVVIGALADVFGWPLAIGCLVGLSGIALLAVALNWTFDVGL